MEFTPVTFIRLVWFVFFGVAAYRKQTLAGKNVFVAVMTGLSATWIALYFSDLLKQWGLADWADFQRPSLNILLEGLYILCFLGVFALLRRLFKLRGFGRDFWLLAGCAAPLFSFWFLTGFLLYVSFFADNL